YLELYPQRRPFWHNIHGTNDTNNRTDGNQQGSTIKEKERPDLVITKTNLKDKSKSKKNENGLKELMFDDF
ncbi:MAG: hypothetical protein EZS28_048571, partial [Streblomastix strix]